MPVDYRKYPTDWKAIRARILERAGNRCEGSPAFPYCRAENGKPHPITRSTVILTIAHMDHDLTNNSDTNLRALCQRCHNKHDAADRAKHAAEKRRAAKAKRQPSLF